VLYKIAGLIRKRHFNIESLTVSHSVTPGVSRFTIVVHGNESIVEKMTKQLYRIIEVLKIQEVTDSDIVARELGLFKISTAKPGSRVEISSVAGHFRARIVQVAEKHMVIEVTGTEEKIDSFRTLMNKFGIMDFVRTGRSALMR
jgi:acetolactate synthase-1/3 small subunit